MNYFSLPSLSLRGLLQLVVVDASSMWHFILAYAVFQTIGTFGVLNFLSHLVLREREAF